MERDYTSKAIETYYRGVKFRSRLEAKCAVFFDGLGVDWSYEPEGFEFESGRYLPDFYFPALKFWVEIKPSSPTQEEQAKCHALAEFRQEMVYCFFSQIRDIGVWGATLESAFAYFPEGGWDNYHAWCECPDCGMLGVQFEGRAARLPCDCLDGDRGHNDDSRKIIQARDVALNYRFGAIA